MRDLILLAIHLLVTLSRFLRPGGVRAVAAESLVLKHQLLICNRSRRRAPNLSHPFVERLIGTIRREHLDRTFFWNALDLERKLQAFSLYYNESRVHQSLSGNTPVGQAAKPRQTYAALDRFGWREHCRGLFQTPIAA